MEELWRFLRTKRLYTKSYEDFQQQFSSQEKLELLRTRLVQDKHIKANSVEEMLAPYEGTWTRRTEEAVAGQKKREQQQQQQAQQVAQEQPEMEAPEVAEPQLARPAPQAAPQTAPETTQPGMQGPFAPGRGPEQPFGIPAGVTAPRGPFAPGKGPTPEPSPFGIQLPPATPEEIEQVRIEREQEQMFRAARERADNMANIPGRNFFDGIFIEGGKMLGVTATGLAEVYAMGEAAMKSYWNGTPGLWAAPYIMKQQELREKKGEGIANDLVRYAEYKDKEAEIRRMYADTESVLYKLGGVIPSIAGVATAVVTAPVSPGTSAVIGGASLTQLSLQAFGSGIESYDKYKQKTGADIDPAARLGVGLLYGSAEFAMEKIPIAKFLTPVQRAALRGKMGQMMFGAVPNEVQEKMAKELFEEFAKKNTKAQKILEGAKQSGEGFVVEGGTEALTSIAQEFTDWLYMESKDRSSWNDVAKGALENFALGGAMGTGMGGLSYGMTQVANRRRREQAGKVVIAQDKKTGEAVEIVGVSGQDEKGAKTYRAIRPNGKETTVSEENIGRAYTAKTSDFYALLKGIQDGNTLNETANTPEGQPVITPPIVGEEITFPTGQTGVISKIEDDGTYVVEDEEGNIVRATREQIDPLRKPIEEIAEQTRDVPTGAEVVDQMFAPAETVNQVYREATAEELTEGLTDEQKAAIGSLHRTQLQSALDGGRIVKDIQDGVLSQQRAQEIFASVGLGNELNAALSEAGIEVLAPEIAEQPDLAARRDALSKEITGMKENPPLFADAAAETQYNLEISDKQAELDAINEQLKLIEDAQKQQGVRVRPEGEQVQGEGPGDQNLPEGDGAVVQDREAAEAQVAPEVVPEAPPATPEAPTRTDAEAIAEVQPRMGIGILQGGSRVVDGQTKDQRNLVTDIRDGRNLKGTDIRFDRVDEPFVYRATGKDLGMYGDAVDKTYVVAVSRNYERFTDATTSGRDGLVWAVAEDVGITPAVESMMLETVENVANDKFFRGKGVVKPAYTPPVAPQATPPAAPETVAPAAPQATEAAPQATQPQAEGITQPQIQQREEEAVLEGIRGRGDEGQVGQEGAELRPQEEGAQAVEFASSESVSIKVGRNDIPYTVGRDANGVIVGIRDASGNDIPKTVQKVSKGRYVTGPNPLYTRIWNQAMGAMSETAIRQDRDRTIRASLDVPFSALEAARQALFFGAKVSRASLRAEIGPDADKASWHGMLPEKSLPSIQALAGRIWEDARSDMGADPPFTDQDVRNALIEGIYLRYFDLDALKEDMYQDAMQQGMPQEGQYSESEEQANKQIPAPTEDMAPEELQQYYAQEFDNFWNSLTDEQRTEYVNQLDETATEPEGAQGPAGPAVGGVEPAGEGPGVGQEPGVDVPPFMAEVTEQQVADLDRAAKDAENALQRERQRLSQAEAAAAPQQMDMFGRATQASMFGEELNQAVLDQREKVAQMERDARAARQEATRAANQLAAQQARQQAQAEGQTEIEAAVGPTVTEQIREKAMGVVNYLKNVLGLGDRVVISESAEEWQRMIDEVTGGSDVLFGILDEIDLFAGDVSAAKKFIDHVFSTVSEADAKAAYRKMSFKYHPDRPGGATEVMQYLNNAWDRYSQGGYKASAGTQSQKNQSHQQQYQTYRSKSASTNYDKAKKRAEDYEESRRKREQMAAEEEARRKQFAKDQERAKAEAEERIKNNYENQRKDALDRAQARFDKAEKQARERFAESTNAANKQFADRKDAAQGDAQRVEILQKELDSALQRARVELSRAMDSARTNYAEDVRFAESQYLLKTNPEEYRRRENARYEMRREQERIRREQERENLKKGRFFFKTDASGIVGFVYNGRMYLNPERISPESVLHENQHLWQEGLKASAKDGDDTALAVMQKRENLFGSIADKLIAGERISDELGVDLTNPVYDRRDGETDEQYRNRVIDELEGYSVGRVAAGVIPEKGVWTKIADYVKSLADWLARQAGFKGKTPEKIMNMTMDEYARAAGISAMKGEFFVSANPVVREIKALPLTRVRGLKMGRSEAEGAYISTERVNRYADMGTPLPVDVDIKNPIKTSETELFQRRKDALPAAKKRFLNRLSEADRQFLEPQVNAAQSFDADELAVPYMMGFGKDLAQAVTDSYVAEGYDSVFIPETPMQEGMLIVFDRSKVKTGAAQMMADALSSVEATTAAMRMMPAVQDAAVKSAAFDLDESTSFYHASPRQRVGRLTPNTAEQFGTGVYFSTNREIVSGEFGEFVTEASLAIENPVYTNTNEWYAVQKRAIELADQDYADRKGLTERDLDEDKGYYYYDPEDVSDADEIPAKFISDAAKELGHDAIINRGGEYQNEISVIDESKIIYPEDKPAFAAEAYHIAKAEVSNPELVQTVEMALSPEMRMMVADAQLSTPEQQQATQQAIETAKAAFPNVDVASDVAAVDAAKQVAVERGELQPGQNPLGFVVDGEVFIDPRVATPETVMHEYGHVWSAWLKINDTAKHRRGLELMRGTVYEARVRNNPGYAGKSDYAVLEEALAQAIGEKAGALWTDRQKMSKFRKWLDEMWNAIRSYFGGKPIEHMTMEEFVDKAVKDLVYGGAASPATSKDIARAEAELRPMFLEEKTAAHALGPLMTADMARRMEAQGRDMASIEATTGWIKGPDGKWRAHMDWLVETSLKKTPAAGDTLGDIIDSPSMFEAFPEVKDIPVVLQRGKFKAAYSFNGTILLNPDYLDAADLVSNIYHETQHYFQHREGFIYDDNTTTPTAAEAVLWDGIGGFPQEWYDYTPNEVQYALQKMAEDLKETDPNKAAMAGLLAQLHNGNIKDVRTDIYLSNYAEIMARAAAEGRSFYDMMESMGFDAGQVWWFRTAADAKSFAVEPHKPWRPSVESKKQVAAWAEEMRDAQERFMDTPAFMSLLSEAMDAMDNNINSFQRFSDVYGLESNFDAYNAWMVAKQMRDAANKEPWVMQNMGNWRDWWVETQIDDIAPVRKMLADIMTSMGVNTTEAQVELDLYKSSAEEASAKVIESIFGPLRSSFFTNKPVAEELSGDTTSMNARAKRDGIELNDIGMYMALKHAPSRNARVSEMRAKLREEYIAQLEKAADIAEKQGEANRAQKIADVIEQVRMNNYADTLWNGQDADLHAANLVGTSEINNTDMGSGISTAEANQRRQEMAPTPELEAKYEAYAQEIRDKLITPRLDGLLAEGIIKQEQYDALVNGTKEGYDTILEDYVPLSVQDEMLGAVTDSTIGTAGTGIYSLVGSERYTLDSRHNPIAVLAIQFASANRIIARNRMMRMLADSVQKANAAAAAEGKGTMYHVNADKNELMRDPGVLQEDGTVKYFKGDATRRREYIRSNSIAFYRDGNRMYLTMPGHVKNGKVRKHPVVSALSQDTSNDGVFGHRVEKMLQFFMNVRRLSLTQLNIWFGMDNFVRDNQAKIAAMGIFKDVEILKTTLTSIARGGSLRTTFSLLNPWKLDKSTDDYFREYQEQGGFMSWANRSKIAEDVKGMQEIMDQLEEGNYNALFGLGKGDAKQMAKHHLATYRNLLKKSVSLIGAFNDAMENGTRLSTYIALRKQGIDAKKAAYVAKNITINFERKGRIGRKLNNLWLFYSVAWQGAYQSYKIATSKRGAAMLALTAGSAAALRAFAYLATEDDEEKRDHLMKFVWTGQDDRSWLVHNPWDETGTPIKVPRPYGPLRIVSGFGDKVIDVAVGMKTPAQATLELIALTKGAFLPVLGEVPSAEVGVTSLSPEILKPMVEVAVNTNFKGQEIVPRFGPKTEEGRAQRRSELYTKYTSPIYVETFKWLEQNTRIGDAKTGWIDWSPAAVEHVVKTMTGGMIKKSADAIMAFETPRTVIADYLGSEQKGEPGFDFTSFPLTRSYYQRLDKTTQANYWAVKDALSSSGKAPITPAEARFLDESLNKLVEGGWMKGSTARANRKLLRQKYKAFAELD